MLLDALLIKASHAGAEKILFFLVFFIKYLHETWREGKSAGNLMRLYKSLHTPVNMLGFCPAI